jgi:hypothetical protein
VRERGRHAVVLETPRRVQPFVLEEQTARRHADVKRDLVGLLEDGAALADRDDVPAVGERQQFVEPPDAGERQRVGLLGPLGLEVAQALRQRRARPVIADVQKVAALRALEERLRDVEPRAASRPDAFLIRDVRTDGDGRTPFVVRRPARIACTGGRPCYQKDGD